MQIGGVSPYSTSLYTTQNPSKPTPAPNTPPIETNPEFSANSEGQEKSQKLTDLKAELKQKETELDAKETELDASEQKEVDQLKARDQEVRVHEAAHLAAAGGFAQGGASYSYQTGPDGRRYAVGGEVSINTSAVPGDPEATIRKAQTIRRAALAPSEPSGQDQSVALQASRMEQEARQEVSENRSSNNTPTTGEEDSDPLAPKEANEQGLNATAPTPQNQRAINAFEQNLDKPRQQFDLFA